MCMNMCSQMIEPNAQLKKMLIMLRIILGITVALLIAKAIYWGVTKKSPDLFTNLFCLFILIIVNINLYFSCGMMLLFFIIIRLLTSFFLLGSFIQKVILIQPGFTKEDYGLLGLTTFEFCFHIFSIMAIFPMYKEMKAIYIENGPIAPGGGNAGANYQQHRDQENQLARNQEPPSGGSSGNSGGNFRAFQGRGVAVGGN